MDLMHRDNLSGAESKELIAKAMKMISDWKNDLIPPEQAHTTCETRKMFSSRIYTNFMSVICVPITLSILMT